MLRLAGKPVAGALNLAGDEALYGRNWGCRGDWPFLHFELCYYRAIDWAIGHGREAGRGRRPGAAQDPARLFAENPTYSRALDHRTPACAGRWRIFWLRNAPGSRRRWRR